MIWHRRDAVGALAAIAVAGCAPALQHKLPRRPGLIGREGLGLVRDGAPYRVVGTNMWYAAWLGAPNNAAGQARLSRELDRLRALGINNVRIMAAAEEGPLRNAISPGFTRRDGSMNPDLLIGLDHVLIELAKRGMTAVLCLGNFWEWSGGMMTWLHRVTGRYIDMGDPAHPWPAFADATAAFYADDRAVALYHDYVRLIVSRRNALSGIAYAEDPAIMSWQLANEPRPGGSDAVIEATLPAYYRWIEATAALIRSIDRAHMVSLGQEGTIAANMREDVALRAHRDVDYVTAHIWPLNWGWVKGNDLAGTWTEGAARVTAYLDAHERIAVAAGKPLLIEEFGFPRDGERYAPDAPTTYRARFYALIYAATERSRARGGPIAGSNFWAWNGEARAAHADARYRAGDTAYMGDPPHEPQGWYGVFDTDAEMLAEIRKHARRFATP